MSASEAQGRLLELLPTWALQQLDGERLRTDISEIAQDLNYEVYPAARLRHPDALVEIRGDARLQAQLRDILNNATTKPLDELASRFELAAETIAAHLEKTIRRQEEADQVTLRTGLSFVRPDLYTRDASGRSVLDERGLSGYTPASEARSRAVWEAARSGQAAQFVLTPSDLYGTDHTRLPCMMGTPIINWTGIYLSGVAETLSVPFNNRPFNPLIEADELGRYPSSEGLIPYRMLNPALRVGPVKVAAGLGSQVATAFGGAPRALAGMSPFTTMRFDFAGLLGAPERPLDQANEIVLVFEVDTVSTPGLACPRGAP